MSSEAAPARPPRAKCRCPLRLWRKSSTASCGSRKSWAWKSRESFWSEANDGAWKLSRKQAARFRRPTVVALEWTDPIFAMGNWGPELVEIANGEALLGHKGEYSAAIPAEQLRDADPEYLIVAPCGFNLERTLAGTSRIGALSLVGGAAGGSQRQRRVRRRQPVLQPLRNDGFADSGDHRRDPARRHASARRPKVLIGAGPDRPWRAELRARA